MPKDKKTLDPILIGIVLIILILGVLILASTSIYTSLIKFNNSHYFLLHQLVYGLIPGLFLAIILFKIPLFYLKKITSLLIVINLIVLIAVFLPIIGYEAGGAKRWIKLGGIIFQPSEFLKLTAILYLSALLGNENYRVLKKKYSLKQRKDYNFKTKLIPFLIFLSLISLIFFFQPDISTLGIITLTSLIIYFGARTPLWNTLLMILAGIGGIIYLIKVAPYRLSRLAVFLNPEIDPLGIGFQLKQATIAIGSGGVLGKGLGMSSQKFGFLPNPISDSIFAIFAEETGFLGSFILIFLFLIFFWRGLNIAKKSTNNFAKLVALGISFWITVQAFVNISSLIGVLPLTGIPLPFISYGGSHLTAELAGIGILLKISKEV